MGRSNVVFCMGDSPRTNCYDDKFDSKDRNRTNARGLFRVEKWRNFSFCIDGTSNTIAISESCSGDNYEPTIKGGLAQVNSMSPNGHGGVVNVYNCMLNGVSSSDRNSLSVVANAWRGTHWSDCRAPSAGFTTNLPPNSVACIWDVWTPWIAGGASSYHSGGCNVGFLDGSIRFVSDTVNTGDLTHDQVLTGQSPYGVWGAMGSPAGGESVSL